MKTILTVCDYCGEEIKVMNLACSVFELAFCTCCCGGPITTEHEWYGSMANSIIGVRNVNTDGLTKNIVRFLFTSGLRLMEKLNYFSANQLAVESGYPINTVRKGISVLKELDLFEEAYPFQNMFRVKGMTHELPTTPKTAGKRPAVWEWDTNTTINYIMARKAD